MTVISTLPPSESEGQSTQIVKQIFSSIGRCRFLEERHFDACTALSGSGPAFAAIFLEAMADGGVMMGLPRAEALELAAQSNHTIYLFFALGRIWLIRLYIQHYKARLEWSCKMVYIRHASKTKLLVCLCDYTDGIQIKMIKAPGG